LGVARSSEAGGDAAEGARRARGGERKLATEAEEGGERRGWRPGEWREGGREGGERTWARRTAHMRGKMERSCASTARRVASRAAPAAPADGHGASRELRKFCASPTCERDVACPISTG